MKTPRHLNAACALLLLVVIVSGCAESDDLNLKGSGSQPATETLQLEKRNRNDARKNSDSDSSSEIPQNPRIISGRIVGVSDGDTVSLLTEQRENLRIRLATIDSPEKAQDFGARAKDSLSDLVFNKNVEVEVRSKDRYGRLVGVIRVGGTDVNLEQIKRGMAWHYTQYSKEQPPAEKRVYADAELAARRARVGLWVDPSPVPPWDFRREKRQK